jgi:hypothetical protein
MSKKMFVDLRAGDYLLIGSAKIRLEKKSGQVARLRVEADDDTLIQNPSTARKSALQAQELTHGEHTV